MLIFLNSIDVQTTLCTDLKLENSCWHDYHKFFTNYVTTLINCNSENLVQILGKTNQIFRDCDNKISKRKKKMAIFGELFQLEYCKLMCL